MNNIRQILLLASSNPTWSVIAQQGIGIVDGTVILSPNDAENAAQSSKELAHTYSLRRDVNYFEKGNIFGLDETIESLDEYDRAVRLGYVQTDKGLLILFTEDDSELLCGAIIFISKK